MDTRKITTALPKHLIRLYQWTRRGFPRRCRFYPTCSEYMLQALETRGLVAGVATGLIRILKCHPWHPGGYDPIHPIGTRRIYGA